MPSSSNWRKAAQQVWTGLSVGLSSKLGMGTFYTRQTLTAILSWPLVDYDRPCFKIGQSSSR
jgi:hypothetical protein